jgi:hypothetical protein
MRLARAIIYIRFAEAECNSYISIESIRNAELTHEN